MPKKVKTVKTIAVHFTKGELKAAMIACGEYHGSLQKHPKLQRKAWKNLQSVYITREIYG